jgi:predicted dehydrogenase
MIERTRRAFLKAASGAGLAGAAIAARADDGPPVRVAVIGTGARGSDLIRALSTIDEARIVGVCDDYPPHLELGARYAGPGAKTYADYRKMLDDLTPQAVVIAVPLSLHYPIASACLDAGTAVFLEKTMCHTVDQATRLARQVSASGLVFQVGLQRRSNPIYVQAQAMIESGMIGRVTAIKAQWHRHNSWRRPVPVARTDPRWRALERRLNWRLYRESSGGLMAELGSHQLDVANWFLAARPRRVLASGGIDAYRDGREVFDNITCVFDYAVRPPGKEAAPYTVRVSYSSLCNNAYEGASELILGDKGSLYLTSTKGLLFREQDPDKVWGVEAGAPADADAASTAEVVTAGKTLKLSNDPWAFRGKPIEIDVGEGDDTRDELRSFLDHARRGDVNTVADARVALLDCVTVLTANEAAESGRPVDFPDLG